MISDLRRNAKAGCPISKLLNAEITMDAKLGYAGDQVHTQQHNDSQGSL